MWAGGLMRRCLLMVLALLGLALPLAARAQARATDFSNWAAVVVAADWRAHDGSDAPIFDNARRDVVQLLQRQGFRAGNIAQMTSASSPDEGVALTSFGGLLEALERTTAQAPAGCLIYFSSHGSPQGIVFGRTQALTPDRLAAALGRYCAGRPTIAVISACFSGVFVPALAAENRMVLTAARPDRTSFGCGATNRYPYFDECVLQVGPNSADWPALGEAAQTCVAMREAAEGLSPPSEPQLSVGSGVAPLITGGRLRSAVQADAFAGSGGDGHPEGAGKEL